ncbi:hypothetical protein MHU86_21330 [Fragilaria crotonensis]|nr:hypothetical protein MHU86_21330 [Fragilaria crotonensis]
MAKEKRKYRLDKGSTGASSGEFLGLALLRRNEPSILLVVTESIVDSMVATLSALDSARRRLPKVWKTLIERHKELSGMIWCAQADPSTDVKSSTQNLSKSLSVVDWPGSGSTSVEFLVTADQKLCSTIFSPGNLGMRLRLMRNVNNSMSASSAFWYGTIRVVLVVPQLPESGSFTYDSFITDRILWKPLTSARNSFRLKAYQLLGACCMHAKSIVYGPTGSCTLPALLPNIVAQEKDPTNVPYVFDVLLLYLTSGDSSALDRGQLVKMINRMIKKACFGSSPSGWAPAILPLLVSIDDNSLIISVISSLLEGCGATIGLGDSLTVASAVAESACYFMIRSDADDLVDAEFSEALATYWCKTLGIFSLRARSIFDFYGGGPFLWRYPWKNALSVGRGVVR